MGDSDRYKHGLLAYFSEEEREDYIRATAKDTVTIRGDIPPDLQIKEDMRLLVISDDQTYLTHGLHKYPAKFIPEYPRWAIQKFLPSPGHTVLDPFCGSGTTNVEARLHKQDSYGIDIDPLARFITKVKTTPLDISILEQAQKRILSRLQKPVSKDVEIPDFSNRDYWFRKEVSRDLAYLKRVISEEITENDVRDFFLLCFSSTIRKVSNADPELVLPKISRVMREKERKGRSIDVFASFRAILKRQMPNIKMFSLKCPKSQPYFSQVIGKDARQIGLPRETVDLAITSPPYLNAHDYVRAHHLEMYWLGMLSSAGDKLKLKSKYIGTEQVHVGDYAQLHRTGYHKLDGTLERIYAVDKRRAYIVYNYFVDMKKTFKEVYRVLRPGSHYVMFTGDNVIRKIPVQTHGFLVECAEDVGFLTELTFASELIKRFEISENRNEHGGLIKEDWVLVFRKE